MQIKFVGQPIFAQMLQLVSRHSFGQLVAEHESDRYYKSFKSWDQLVTMLFGIFSRCDSMAETCEGLRVMTGKLNHLDLKKAPSKSSAGDGLRNRSHKFFEALYYQLLEKNRPFLSVSRTAESTARSLHIIDSTTIGLFSDLLKGVGRNPAGDGRKKGGLKVHMLTDAHGSVGTFMTITEARTHDRKFLADVHVAAHSTLVFDKAYTDYRQFLEWTEKEIFFVTRQKENARFEVEEILMEKMPDNQGSGVLKDELIRINVGPNGKTQELLLKRVSYRDEKGRDYVFLSNNLNMEPEEVALIYKQRWGIELLFKKMKQNFQLNYFYGENENAIRTQVWCTLIAQLLITVVQNTAKVKKAFSTVATLLRIHLISMLDLQGLIIQTPMSAKQTREFSKQKTLDLFSYSLFT